MHVTLEENDFFVQIHDLPLPMMNLGVATLIGNKIGFSRDLKVEDSGCLWGTSLRVRVGLNVNRPLKRALKATYTSTVRFGLKLGFLTCKILPHTIVGCGCRLRLGGNIKGLPAAGNLSQHSLVYIKGFESATSLALQFNSILRIFQSSLDL
ncbi:UNVERIFIED_CONTAM: hypothetical protein Scaly_1916700 [Sesamum calycinum]|uniref:Uncharacterized protein n=1 Tax=Sesamum calycinum TaxID=2727403 RepID=A0AAW2NGF1_9LAMI